MSAKTKKFDVAKFNRQIEAKKIRENERLLSELVKLIPLAPGIEWDIVHNFLQREGLVVESREEADRRFRELAQRLGIQRKVEEQYPRLAKEAKKRASGKAKVSNV